MPAVYDLFDDILVLSEGRVVFHGQREEVGAARACCNATHA